MDRFLRSLRHAVRGIGYALRHERNFRLEFIVGVCVLVLMFLLPLSYEERLIVFVVTICVFILELINTSIERVVDILKPRVHPYAKVAKDVMAAAVLLAALGAATVGIAIFLPYIMQLI